MAMLGTFGLKGEKQNTKKHRTPYTDAPDEQNYQ